MSLNDRHYCFCPSPQAGKPSEAGKKAALLRETKWQANTNITIRFLDGSPALREKVMKYVREWTDIAGLTFSVVDAPPSDIRIAFKEGAGSWSYLGIQCRDIPEPQPTMNYGWLNEQTDEAEFRRVVLHEFGHALGLIHEHQNPREPIEWNRAAVVADLSKPPNNWDLATIENNMFKKYENVDATNVDVDSIMMYPIPQAWLVRGRPAGFNSNLSDTDRRFIAEAYPKI